LTRLYEGGVPGNGAVLATAGGLIFWGDMNRRFRAFDAKDGEILWESLLGGIVQMSTISYAVEGRQYIAVMTGDGNSANPLPDDVDVGLCERRVRWHLLASDAGSLEFLNEVTEIRVARVDALRCGILVTGNADQHGVTVRRSQIQVAVRICPFVTSSARMMA
jgi:outer membrane protein assembly factor BamB